MKKLIILFFLVGVSVFGFSQSVTIVPTDYGQITLKGNVGGITGTVNASIFIRNNARDAAFSTKSYHPISFRTYALTEMRLNPGGDLGIGNAIVSPIWDGSLTSANNKILSKLHSYGLGQRQFSGPTYASFQTAMLGQAVGDAADFNRAGVLGISDGKATDGYYNIGVASFATSDPEALSDTYNFWGYNRTTSGRYAYGIYNVVSTAGAGNNYGSYNEVSRTGGGISYGTFNSIHRPGTSSTGTSYGTYNAVGRSSTGTSYGTYNLVSTSSTGNVYGARNEANVNTGNAYGSYNIASAGTSTGNTYANYNVANTAGTAGTSHGTYNTVSGNRALYGIRTIVNKTGTGIPSVYGMFTKLEVISTANYAYGSRIEVNNPSTSSFSIPYGLYSVVKNSGPYGGYGLYAEIDGNNGYAGYFKGKVHVSGELSKSSGSFKIDHPQDPENKYLVHSFVESPDMMNIYNGNVTTDASGEATVEMPGYFDALNKDFRYQLTVIGTFAQAIVLEKLSGNTFVIKTDKPNIEVSWQVTGVRQDAYANANRIVPEVDKDDNEKGKYLNPEVFGKTMMEGLHTSVRGKEGFAASSSIDEIPQDQEPEEEEVKKEEVTIKQDTTPRTVVLPDGKNIVDEKRGDN